MSPVPRDPPAWGRMGNGSDIGYLAHWLEGAEGNEVTVMMRLV